LHACMKWGFVLLILAVTLLATCNVVAEGPTGSCAVGSDALVSCRWVDSGGVAGDLWTGVVRRARGRLRQLGTGFWCEWVGDLCGTGGGFGIDRALGGVLGVWFRTGSLDYWAKSGLIRAP
jgi:hypothetical protein